MALSVPLVAIVLCATIILSPVAGRKCYSSTCEDDEPICEVTCPATFYFCSAFYEEADAGGLGASLFGCLSDSLGENVTEQCSIEKIDGTVRCFCDSDLCNNIGIPKSTTTTPPTTMPTSAPGSAPVRGSKPTGLDPSILYCRHSERGADVGYQVCQDDQQYNESNPYHRGCYGAYRVLDNGTLVAENQHCIADFFGFCNFSGCQFGTQSDSPNLLTTLVYCCCNTNECNLDTLVLHPDHPIYPTEPPHSPEEHQICQYTNCSINPVSPLGERHCFNGFIVCSEHSLVEGGLYSSNKSHHSCVSIHEPVLDSAGGVKYNANGEIDIRPVYRGCLFSDTDCVSDTCTLNATGDGHYTCCCQGDLCNVNEDRVVTISPPPTTPGTTTQSQTDINIIIFGVILFVCLLLILALIVGFAFCFLYSRKLTRHAASNRNGNGTVPSVTSSDYPLLRSDSVYTRCSLIERIGHGRFGKVWRGQCDADVVAVKVFPQEDYNSWESEVAMYETEHLSHPYLLRFLGKDIREEYPGRSIYWIVTEYHQLGSLMDYLQRETLSLREFCVMCETAAAGLAHLHLEKTINGTLKPSIAHRDLKSKNILVKSDRSCCISDLGLAVKLDPGELGTQAEYQCQVGTPRYMSPEVLGGAISFNREAFLRIDAYALGLICWEIAIRTIPGDAASQLNSYQQPYEEYVGSNPGIDEMKAVVVDDRCRPEFPSSFNSNPQLDRIVSTIQECWDSDPEARLTAQCVQGRFQEFYQSKVHAGNESFEWSKETGYTSHASFLPDDSNKKVSTSEYASADSPSPSSINCSTAPFMMSSYSSPGTGQDFDSLQRSSTASTMRPAVSTSGSTYASSEQVGSMTRLLLSSRSPPMRGHQRMDLHETTV